MALSLAAAPDPESAAGPLSAHRSRAGNAGRWRATPSTWHSNPTAERCSPPTSTPAPSPRSTPQTNEVGGTYPIGNKPSFAIVSNDNSTLWVSNFGSDSINLWSIDDAQSSRQRLHRPCSRCARLLRRPASPARRRRPIQRRRRHPHRGQERRPALFTILPAGRSPNAIVIKAMQGKP